MSENVCKRRSLFGGSKRHEKTDRRVLRTFLPDDDDDDATIVHIKLIE